MKVYLTYNFIHNCNYEDVINVIKYFRSAVNYCTRKRILDKLKGMASRDIFDESGTDVAIRKFKNNPFLLFGMYIN